LLKIIIKKKNNLGYATRESFSGSVNINLGSNAGNLFAKAYSKRPAEEDGNTGGEGLGSRFIAIPNNYSAFPASAVRLGSLF
jgi:hypothetical protein